MPYFSQIFTILFFLVKRNEMSEKYKHRVANFVKDMAEEPVQLIDYYEPSKTNRCEGFCCREDLLRRKILQANPSS